MVGFSRSTRPARCPPIPRGFPTLPRPFLLLLSFSPLLLLFSSLLERHPNAKRSGRKDPGTRRKEARTGRAALRNATGGVPSLSTAPDVSGAGRTDASGLLAATGRFHAPFVPAPPPPPPHPTPPPVPSRRFASGGGLAAAGRHGPRIATRRALPRRTEREAARPARGPRPRLGTPLAERPVPGREGAKRRGPAPGARPALDAPGPARGTPETTPAEASTRRGASTKGQRPCSKRQNARPRSVPPTEFPLSRLSRPPPPHPRTSLNSPCLRSRTRPSPAPRMWSLSTSLPSTG